MDELSKYRGGRSGNLVDVLFGSAPGPPFGTARDGPDALPLSKHSLCSMNVLQ